MGLDVVYNLQKSINMLILVRLQTRINYKSVKQLNILSVSITSYDRLLGEETLWLRMHQRTSL